MKIFIITSICCVLSGTISSASIIPASAGVAATAVVTPTTSYAVATGPGIITAHGNQVVTRNYNRLYVPAVAGYVPTLTTTHTIPVTANPHYTNTAYATTTALAAYPTTYKYGTYPYGYYPVYGYGYSYGSTLW